jgi:DnaK suppressor protein
MQMMERSNWTKRVIFALSMKSRRPAPGQSLHRRKNFMNSSHESRPTSGLRRATAHGYKPGKFGRMERMSAVLEKQYIPQDSEPFMNERQVEYFRQKLLNWKDEILRESKETIGHLQIENNILPDIADRASSETDRSLELRTRDRQRKLISKIDAALKRIADGSYGYCEETGDPISLRRLDARPIATLSIEAQERHEKRERVYRDD